MRTVSVGATKAAAGFDVTKSLTWGAIGASGFALYSLVTFKGSEWLDSTPLAFVAGQSVELVEDIVGHETCPHLAMLSCDRTGDELLQCAEFDR